VRGEAGSAATAAGVGAACRGGTCRAGLSSSFMKMASVAAGTAMHERITASVVRPDDDDGSFLSPGAELTSTSSVSLRSSSVELITTSFHAPTDTYQGNNSLQLFNVHIQCFKHIF
jgi:hypothetical protein